MPGIGRPQELINEDVKTSDYFVMVLHDRWGSPPGNEGDFTSGNLGNLDRAEKMHRKALEIDMGVVVVRMSAIQISRFSLCWRSV